MVLTVTGSIVDGKLQLDEQIALPEKTRVQITIVPTLDVVTESQKQRGREAIAALKRIGDEHPLHSGGERFTREELYERD